MMRNRSVLLNTSFFLRFLNDNSPLYKNADDYFRHFLQNEIDMLISTINIAEYCVHGDIGELPLRNLQIVPFLINHSQKTGEFAKIAFDAKKSGSLNVNERSIIPNDTKLFAQADCENTVEYYLSSDTESFKIYNLLKEKTILRFQFIDLHVPCHQTFGFLDF